MILHPDRCLSCGRPLRRTIQKEGEPPKAVVVLTHEDDGTRPCFVLDTEWDDRMPENVRESLKPFLEEALRAVAARKPLACSIVYAEDPRKSDKVQTTVTFPQEPGITRIDPIESLALRLIEPGGFFG